MALAQYRKILDHVQDLDARYEVLAAAQSDPEISWEDWLDLLGLLEQ